MNANDYDAVRDAIKRNVALLVSSKLKGCALELKRYLEDKATTITIEGRLMATRSVMADLEQVITGALKL